MKNNYNREINIKFSGPNKEYFEAIKCVSQEPDMQVKSFMSLIIDSANNISMLSFK